MMIEVPARGPNEVPPENNRHMEIHRCDEPSCPVCEHRPSVSLVSYGPTDEDGNVDGVVLGMTLEEARELGAGLVDAAWPSDPDTALKLLISQATAMEGRFKSLDKAWEDVGPDDAPKRAGLLLAWQYWQRMIDRLTILGSLAGKSPRQLERELARLATTEPDSF